MFEEMDMHVVMARKGYSEMFEQKGYVLRELEDLEEGGIFLRYDVVS